jgi:excinuclease ABC subunit C
MFLEGRTDELAGTLARRMSEAAAAEQFERAAQLRDALRTVQTLSARQQKMATVAQGDRDAFGLKVGPAGAVLQVFQMRGGRVIERIELVAEQRQAGPSAVAPSAEVEEPAEIIEAAIQQFYESREPPPEIHVPVALPEAESLESWLGSKASRRVQIVVPRRGDKRGLLDLASRNAAVAYDTRFNEAVAANYDALETLRAVLALPMLPRRIECFDISTIQGSETVASMVVCEDGRMRRAEYRKFRIRGLGFSPQSLGETQAPDDFAAMEEVVLRRYRKLLEQGGPFPDLILIDGGKGQLTSAYAALRQLGLENLVAVGIAKKEELLFTRDRPDPIALAPESPALHLIQRIRDEAHRFAVTFHRTARRMRDLRSELDAVPGIGRTRRRALLRRFGSVAGVRRATREELMAEVGAKAADAVLRYFAAAPR